MIVKNLIEQIEEALKRGWLNENDEVILLGSGDRESGYLAPDITMPKVYVDIKSHNTGYYHIGFISQKIKNEY